MQKIVVQGGLPLRGEVRISGAKNAVLPILCAGLLADAELVVRNVPNLHDVKTTLRLLAELGCGITLDDSFTIRIDPTRVRNRDHVAPYELVKTMRARSEEHTSELQSLMRISYAVFCLKKNKNT